MNSEEIKEQLAATPSEELEKLIDETEQSVSALREEIERRRKKRQHLEIDHLEDHLQNAKGKWSELKRFFEFVLSDLRK